MSDATPTTSGVASLANPLVAVAAGAALFWTATEFAFRRGLAPLLGDAIGSGLGADMLSMAAATVLLASTIAVLGRRAGIERTDWELSFSMRPVAAGVGGVLCYLVGYGAGAAVLVTVLGLDQSGVGGGLGVGNAPLWALVTLVAVNGVLAPIAEEVAWRGIVQTALVDAWGPIAGVGVTVVLFVTKHLVVDLAAPPLRVASLIAAAAVFGILRQRYGTGSSMVAHVLANSLATAALVFA